MSDKKLYRRFIPVNMYDIPSFEAWLADMAEKGFFLNDFVSQFGKFTSKLIFSTALYLDQIMVSRCLLSIKEIKY
ncbi:hypothetical protein OXPF_00110 [Oxobacter pfennigii]|uniref:Uncharacterized protein n=1 Tax=Oxobacter pfennigii TaxID=36849 RepID=A0A0P9ALT5_9CLOT|nr:hypothetical protein [Oxobacter pfennigii]KPU46369.1 hypothetical protein OXPF_00110 [Oxobacter pfennigii]